MATAVTDQVEVTPPTFRALPSLTAHLYVIHASTGLRRDHPVGFVPLNALTLRHVLTGGQICLSIYEVAICRGIPVENVSAHVAELQGDILRRLAAWLHAQPDADLLHWHWGGFEGLAGLRTRGVMAGVTVPEIAAERCYDLAAWCHARYGQNYVGHPHLLRLAEANRLRGQDWLDEKEAVAAWQRGEHGRLLRSLEAKAGAVEGLYSLALTGKLQVAPVLPEVDGAAGGTPSVPGGDGAPPAADSCVPRLASRQRGRWQPAEGSPPEAGPVRGMSRDEANAKAIALAKRMRKAFFLLSERDQAAMIGCSWATWSKTTFYAAARKKRQQLAPQARRGSPSGSRRAVSLTPKLEAVVGDEDPDLKRLIEDQQADMEPSPLEDDPAGTRRRKVRVFKQV